jgi:acetylornithine deacetylase/succinyl-diaminopimelate desuccinylase-like protein
MKLNLLGDVAELTRQLVDIQSVSGNEAEIADAIEQALKPLSHLSLTRDGNAIVAKTSLGRSQQVVIAGHIDTVPVAENLPSKLMSFEREQVIWGRGTVDMKAGVAVMLKLALMWFGCSTTRKKSKLQKTALAGWFETIRNLSRATLLFCASQQLQPSKVAATEP